MAVLRGFLASRLALGDDEAFYWLWGQRLAPCYYDHPGMVAWMVRLSTDLLGTSPFAVRIPTILVGAANAWLMFLIARRLFNERAGLWAAVLFTFTPLYALGGFLVATDGWLGLFWLLTMWAVAEAVIFERRAYWYAAGAALGLSMVAKFTGVLLAPSALLFAATGRSSRRELARPAIWAAALIALIAFLPVLLWNMDNQWASLAFNLEGRHKGASFQTKWFTQLLGAEMAFLSPLVFVSLAAALLKLGHLRNSTPRYRLLFWFSVPALAVFWGASLITRILPHWPAFGYLALIIGCCGLWEGAGGRKASRAWRTAVVGTAVVFTALMYIQPFYRLLPLKPSDDNTNHVYGWDKVTPVVRQELERLGGTEMAFAAADRYQFAAQLAWNLRLPYDSYSLNPRRDQFDFWITPEKLLRKDAVLVWEEDWGINPEVLQAFAEVREVRTIPVYRQGQLVRTFHILVCRDLRRIP